uniref:Uncharacterized protein n=1 Tax=viral metagenome TaxID=1070528 RepID=A0A6H1ZRJ7_9ZZZZ
MPVNCPSYHKNDGACDGCKCLYDQVCRFEPTEKGTPILEIYTDLERWQYLTPPPIDRQWQTVLNLQGEVKYLRGKIAELLAIRKSEDKTKRYKGIEV